MQLPNEREVKYRIPKTTNGELLVVTMGDKNWYPAQEDLAYMNKLLKEALRHTPTAIVVPYDVKIKKIKIGKGAQNGKRD